ncbi:hypothetical protein [Litorivivens sp.]|uniref:hypothetical protein n=1 Tax=Litorivivens sp. TaxID=2020868 RepID=UPI00356B322E
MDYQFLCHRHKVQLSEHLEAAGPIWSSWMRQGKASLAEGELAQAVQYFGCAFDLALMKVERFTGHAEQDGKRHIDRLLEAVSALAKGLAMSGHLALRREYLGKVCAVLQREQQRTPLLADRLPQPDDAIGLMFNAGWVTTPVADTRQHLN